MRSRAAFAEKLTAAFSGLPTYAGQSGGAAGGVPPEERRAMTGWAGAQAALLLPPRPIAQHTSAGLRTQQHSYIDRPRLHRRSCERAAKKRLERASVNFSAKAARDLMSSRAAVSPQAALLLPPRPIAQHTSAGLRTQQHSYIDRPRLSPRQAYFWTAQPHRRSCERAAKKRLERASVNFSAPDCPAYVGRPENAAA
jgi:hypothetical protein